MASKGRGILAMDESNATCGKRLDSIGVENTETNRRTYRELLVTAPGLSEFISGAILFEETLFQSTEDGTKFTDLLNKVGIMPGAALCHLLWTGIVAHLGTVVLSQFKAGTALSQPEAMLMPSATTSRPGRLHGIECMQAGVAATSQQLAAELSR